MKVSNRNIEAIEVDIECPKFQSKFAIKKIVLKKERLPINCIMSFASLESFQAIGQIIQSLKLTTQWAVSVDKKYNQISTSKSKLSDIHLAHFHLSGGDNYCLLWKPRLCRRLHWSIIITDKGPFVRTNYLHMWPIERAERKKTAKLKIWLNK